MNLGPERLDRFARHIVLPEIGGAGQVALADAHVAIVGLGGIGSPALQYLAGAGIGRLTLIDDGKVELSQPPAPDDLFGARHRPRQGGLRAALAGELRPQAGRRARRPADRPHQRGSHDRGREPRARRDRHFRHPAGDQRRLRGERRPPAQRRGRPLPGPGRRFRRAPARAQLLSLLRGRRVRRRGLRHLRRRRHARRDGGLDRHLRRDRRPCGSSSPPRWASRSGVCCTHSTGSRRECAASVSRRTPSAAGVRRPVPPSPQRAANAGRCPIPRLSCRAVRNDRQCLHSRDCIPPPRPCDRRRATGRRSCRAQRPPKCPRSVRRSYRS